MADEATTIPTIKSETGTDGVTRATVDNSATATPAPKAGDRPAWLPEGFDTPEALAKAYGDLKNGTATSQAKTTTETVPDPAKAVADAGLDMNALSTEYAKDGKLSDKSLEALKQKGITKEQVDSYIEGQQARAREVTTALTDAVGGTETMQAMLSWAAANLSKADQKAYNDAVTSGDVAKAKLAVQGVAQQFLTAAGTDPTLLTNAEGRATLTGVKPFASNAEMVKAMSDKRYRNDPAYREQVARRVNVTNTQSVRSY